MGSSSSKKTGGSSSKEALNIIHSIIDLQEVKFECRQPVLPPKESSKKTEISGIPSDLSRNECIIGEIVAVRDGRERVDATNRWPHSVQGRFAARVKSHQTLLGSGTMIAPNLVLTCAHNLYIRKENKKKSIKIDKKSMTFYPA